MPSLFPFNTASNTGFFFLSASLAVLLLSVCSVFFMPLFPALCAALLTHRQAPTKGFFHWFNNFFIRITKAYGRWTKALFRHTMIVLACVAIIFLAIYQMFRVVPTSFVPAEDQGYVMAAIIMPNSSSLERTTSVLEKIENNIKDVPGVQTSNAISGFSLMTAVSKQVPVHFS